MLPTTPRVGWIPYLWLFWLIGFCAKWFFVPIEPVELTLAVLTLPVFLALYFDGYWHSEMPRVTGLELAAKLVARHIHFRPSGLPAPGA